MSLDEFNNLNTSERARLFGRRYDTFQKSIARVGSSYHGPINAGENVWAIRFTDSEGEVVPGSLTVHILIELVVF